MPPSIKSSTQEHLDIHTIKNHLVYLKDGSVALVLQTTAINFNLLSQEEQNATIYSYASFLNSLTFPVQIILRSQRKNIADYLDRLDQRIQEVSSQKIKESIIKYRQFVKSLVKKNRVLEKKFYIIIPFSAIELGLTTKSFNPFVKEPQKPAYDLKYITDKATLTLYPRRDHIIRQMARLGLKTRQLTTPELIDLFHQIYNQKDVSSKSNIIKTQDINPAVTTAQPKARNIFQQKPSPPPPTSTVPIPSS